MKKNFLLSIFALSFLISCEDDNPKPVVTPDLTNYEVSSLAIDNSDRLWVGTDSGLYKSVSGGYQWTDIITDAPVTSIAFEESNNTLWIGTVDGLSKLKLDGSKAESIAKSNLSNSSIKSIHINPDSEKWIGSDTGISRNNLQIWQREKFKKNLSGTITAAVFEKFGINAIGSWDGDYYFATNGHSVYRTYGWNETVNAFSGASQLLNPYNGTSLSDTMYVVFTDSKGMQWMGGNQGLVAHLGHDPKAENTSYYSELSDPRVHCVSEAPDGKIWVGTENGISIFDGTNWTNYTATLPDNFVTAIAFQSNGKVWIGTKKGLVSSN
jgi:ligand-binding sensor domain-containing protein